VGGPDGEHHPIKHASVFNRDVVPTVVCVNKSTLGLGVDFDKLGPGTCNGFVDEVFAAGLGHAGNSWSNPKTPSPVAGIWVFLNDGRPEGHQQFHDITYEGMADSPKLFRQAG